MSFLSPIFIQQVGLAYSLLSQQDCDFYIQHNHSVESIGHLVFQFYAVILENSFKSPLVYSPPWSDQNTYILSELCLHILYVLFNSEWDGCLTYFSISIPSIDASRFRKNNH